MSQTDTRRHLGRWAGGVAVVVGLVVGLLVVVPAWSGGGGPAEPEIAQAVGPPSFEQVLAIRDQLRAAAASSDYPVDQAALADVVTAPGPYVPLGRIGFPTTGLDVEYGAGVQPSVLERGPGHWPGTALAGQLGNGVISGHRTTFTHPFGDLDLLQPGDPVELTPPGAAAPFVYRVIETVVLPEAEYADFVLRQPVDASARELTLFACEPKGNRTHRIIVRAAMEPTGAASPQGGG